MLAQTWTPTGRRHDLASARRRGTALAMSLFVVTIVAMLGAGFLQITSSVLKRRGSSIDRMQAFYLAEAGLAESFQAVRMGRTGQIGSETEPARHGNGLLWVDVVELEDGSVRLDSTGLSGRGRASLALVVEPIEKELGFFADEDLVVDSVLLVDGWDSEEGTYLEQSGQGEAGTVEIDLSYPFLHIDGPNHIVFYEGTFYRFSTVEGDLWSSDPAHRPRLTVEDSVDVATLDQLDGDGYDGVDFDIDAHDFTDEDWQDDYDEGEEYDGVLEYFRQRMKQDARDSDDDDDDDDDEDDEDDEGASDHVPSDPGDSEPATDEPEPSDPVPPTPSDPIAPAPHGGDLGPTTGGGALLGSNGDVRFSLPDGQTGEIWGDVQPGPNSSVTGLDSVTVSGSTDSRTTEVELPEVEVPIVAPQPALRHDDLLPMLVSQGTSGYERIEVAADAELILRGPAEIVIGELVLEPGATLTLDTRAGEVALYVTNELDLQPGSVVETTGDEPEDTTVQVSADDVDPLDPSVKLDGSSQFYGTIYAPDAGVRIGSDFEIFGSVVARRLDVGAGARLHFDNAGFENSALPKIVGWRVTEVPAAARKRTDPFKLMGVDKATVASLSDSHDLGSVDMELVYLDHGGVERSFLGKEDQFDWDLVDEVVQVDRDPTRPKDPDAGEPPIEEPPREEPPIPEPVAQDPPRADVADKISTLTGKDLKNALQAKTPLLTSELLDMVNAESMGAGDTKQILLASTPMAEDVLVRLIESDSRVNSKELKDVLIANSPLPPDVLEKVQANDANLLKGGDLDKVLQAN